MRIKTDWHRANKWLEHLEDELPKINKKILKELAEQEIAMERAILKAESTKQDWPWHSSPYKKIADNLKVSIKHKGDESPVTVLTAPFPDGPLGSREGKLALIHIRSKSGWNYGLYDDNKMVASSGKWEKYEGAYDYDVPWFLIKGLRHPGFKRQPYIERIYNRMKEKYPEAAEKKIRPILMKEVF